MSPAAIGRFHRSSGEDADRVTFGDDVPSRLPVDAASLVEPAQAGVERAVGGLLHPDIKRRGDREALFVEHLGAVLALEVLADFLHEEGRDAGRLVRLAAGDDRLRLGGVGDRLRDVALVGHALQDDIAARDRALHVDVRALSLRRLEDAGNQRGFFERQLLVGLAEIHPRRSFDAVGAVPEIHLAADGEDPRRV